MLKTLFLLVACCVVAVWPSPRAVRWYDLERADQLFEEFIKTHQRQYKDEEEKAMRSEIFKKNLENINQLNSESKTATYGINRFTDMIEDEIFPKFTGSNHEDSRQYCRPGPAIKSGPVPESFDWRDHNKVTRVRDIQNCHVTYWAASVVGNLEGLYAIKYNELIELSEQQLIDCNQELDFNCTYISSYRGDESALGLVRDHGGIESEADYPYIAKKGLKCRFDKNNAVLTVSDCYIFNVTNEDDLKSLLVTTGPLIIEIVGRFSPINGIVDTCDRRHFPFSVLLVGYGSENGTPYWSVKFPYGESFGERGYVRLLMYKKCLGVLNRVKSAAIN